MNYAFIEEGVCTNTAVFEDELTAKEFGYIPLQEGYGVGDSFDGQEWTKKETPLPPVVEPSVEERIAFLKAQLTATDYQIIKAYEYALMGLEIEYDIPALHEERQALRDQINELEQQIGQA